MNHALGGRLLPGILLVCSAPGLSPKPGAKPGVGGGGDLTSLGVGLM